MNAILTSLRKDIAALDDKSEARNVVIMYQNALARPYIVRSFALTHEKLILDASIDDQALAEVVIDRLLDVTDPNRTW